MLPTLINSSRLRVPLRRAQLPTDALLTVMLLTATLLMSLGSAGARADSLCLRALATVPDRGQPPPCWRPFTSDSPLNTELGANPRLAPDNDAIRRHMAIYHWNLQGSSTSFQFSADDGTRPVYFGRSSDPVMRVRCTDEDGPETCQGANAIDVNGARIHVPAGAQPGHNWDAHMVIVETDTGEEYDFWHSSISGSTLTAEIASSESTTTSPGTADQGDAANLALTAGLLRPSELASGDINHALVLGIPCTNAHGANVGYVWPAVGGWGGPCDWNESPAGLPAMGQLFKLEMTGAQIAGSRAPRWERTIMTALARYGAYVEDVDGGWHNEGMYILAQDEISWTSLGQPNQWLRTIDRLGGHHGTLTSPIPIPTRKLEVVVPRRP